MNKVSVTLQSMGIVTPPEEVGYMPEGANCPTCGWLMTDTPERKAYAKRRQAFGLPLGLCRCPETAERQWRARLEWAKLPHEHTDDHRTFSTWTGDANAEALAATQAFAKGEGPHALTLVGEPDGGKSHLLEAIGRFSIAAERSVRYVLAMDFVDEMRMASASDETTAGQLMEAYYHTAVVLLDDIALERANDFAIERLTALVDYRYRNGLRLAVATNVGPQTVKRGGLTIPGITDRLGERMASRLFDVGTGAVSVQYVKPTGHRHPISHASEDGYARDTTRHEGEAL